MNYPPETHPNGFYLLAFAKQGGISNQKEFTTLYFRPKEQGSKPYDEWVTWWWCDGGGHNHGNYFGEGWYGPQSEGDAWADFYERAQMYSPKPLPKEEASESEEEGGCAVGS